MTFARHDENRLLGLLRQRAPEVLSMFVPVQLHAREVLAESGMPVLHVYFPVSSVVALVSSMESGAAVGVGLIGCEGMVGLDAILGTVEGPTTAIVQVPGLALRAPVTDLKAARATSAVTREMLDLYGEARFIQVAQTAACHRVHPVQARLAHWLLSIDDRIEGSTFAIAHEFISDMVGAPRPSIGTALQALERLGAITQQGEAIAIVNREALQASSCECYGVVQREFARLLRPHAAGPDALAQSAEALDGSLNGQTAAAVEGLREIAGRLLLVSLREQRAREQAETANRFKDEFLAMVSHELRTPLHSILGWCSILAKQEYGPATRGLQVIERNARVQLALVEDLLLDAAGLASEPLRIEAAPVNLSELVESAVDTLKPIADEKDVTLRMNICEEMPEISADSDRLRQVLANVVSNAVKFTRNGGAVDVLVSSAHDNAQVIVRDTGQGIAPDVLPHVFDRFRQGRTPAPGQRGVGLGLTIARVLVELHGGTIEIESPGEGQGTTCIISLPQNRAVEVPR